MANARWSAIVSTIDSTLRHDKKIDPVQALNVLKKTRKTN